MTRLKDLVLRHEVPETAAWDGVERRSVSPDLDEHDDWYDRYSRRHDDETE